MVQFVPVDDDPFATDAPALTIQGPGNLQAAPSPVAGPVDPNAQGAPQGAPIAAAPAPQFIPVDGDPFADAPNDAPQPQDPGVLQHIWNAASRVPKNLGDKLSNIADGLPFSDRARAGLEAATGIGGTYGDYSGDLAATQAAAAQRMQQNPTSAVMGQVLGGSLLPIPGLGAATEGATLGAKVLGGATAGAGIGSLYGASASPDLGNWKATAASTGLGAGAGAIAGGVVPAVGSGVGSLYRGVFGQAVPKVVGPSGPINQAAQEAALKAIEADTPGAISQGVRNLGPNSMLADYGPSLQGLAQGVAVKPQSPAAQVVTNALTARNAGVNDRLGQVVDQNLGPVTSPMAHAADVNNAIQPLAIAQQQALRSAGPVDISPVYQRLQQAIPDAAPGSPEHGALTGALHMLSEPGEDGAFAPTTNAQRIDSARKTLDDALYPAVPGGQVSSAMRDQLGAYQGARQGLSNALKDQIPAYKDATEAIAQIAPRRGAYDTGLTDLTRDVSHYPADYRQAYEAQAPNVQGSQAAGMRMAIAQALGTKENDLQALRNVTQGANGWNAQNLGTVFGQDQAARVNEQIAAEQKMRDTYGKVVEGSKTAKVSAAVKSLADTEHEVKELPHVHNLTLEGMVATPLRYAANKVYGAFQRPIDNTARDLGIAHIATSQGDQRNQILADLLAASRVRTANQALAAPAASAGSALAAISPAVLAAVLRERRQTGQQGR